MSEPLWRKALRVALPPGLLAALLFGISQSETARRLAIGLLDPGLPAVAAELSVLEPTFDGADQRRPQQRVILEPVIQGVVQPTDLAFVPGRSDRVVVLSKGGTAWLASLDASGTAAAPASWFTLEVATASELGLLGIAFHPDFATNGLLFVNATPKPAGPTQRLATQILKLRTDPATLSPPKVEQVILEVEQPYQNHDAGQLLFGPDKMLYIALGDGGFRADPHGHGQNLGTLLGSMLRIDVDRASPYAIPDDNPFRSQPGARPEIWAYGLRNPWRFTFDPRGRMVVADVGQNAWEEIDLVSAGDNLGWNVREADTCFDPPRAAGPMGCRTRGLVDPIWKYGREEGVSVTGGVVWTAPGPLAGRYLFGDFATGRLWALALPETARPVETVTALGKFTLNPSAFARTPTGEVWVADFGRGGIFRIIPR